MSLTPAPVSPPPAPEPIAPRELSRARLVAAWVVALTADAIQWVLLPLFTAGLLSPVDDVLDVAVGVLLWRLLGWHWVFLPSFAVELIPGVDLAPCWLIAVAIATRRKPVVPSRTI